MNMYCHVRIIIYDVKCHGYLACVVCGVRSVSSSVAVLEGSLAAARAQLHEREVACSTLQQHATQVSQHQACLPYYVLHSSYALTIYNKAF